ncbi:PspA/IM30 family protein [Paenibacillus tyrfis]|uniref:PspA/IM30 family protein n=1 Tax=Paenibacillus tyrfis TaxID=1501230 RepID=UPI001377A926|nr:PspA/IM30 family protein [Paenibacillus tyrfis]
MGVLTRLSDLSRAAAHEALSKLEDPVMMLNHYLRTMKEEIDEVQRTLNKQSGAERSLKMQIDAYNRLAAQCEKNAAEALADGREEEARQAMEAKLHYLDKSLECSEWYEAAKQRLEELSQQLEETKAAYAAMQEKRTELVARAQKVEAQVKPSAPRFLYSFEGGAAARGFDRIEERIMQSEALAELSRRPAAQR